MTRKLPESPSERERGMPKKIMMVGLSGCWWRRFCFLRCVTVSKSTGRLRSGVRPLKLPEQVTTTGSKANDAL